MKLLLAHILMEGYAIWQVGCSSWSEYCSVPVFVGCLQAGSSLVLRSLGYQMCAY